MFSEVNMKMRQLPRRRGNRSLAIGLLSLLVAASGMQPAWARSGPAQKSADAAQGGVAASAPQKIPGAKYTTDFDWFVHPTTALDSAGPATVDLPSCPSSVTGSEPEYWVYISGTENPEAVKVTGGTCAGDGKPGTLRFTTLNPHRPGYAIGSASGGLQEASMAARIPSERSSALAESSTVVVPPGTDLHIYGRVSIRGPHQVIDFSGSVFDCYMSDTCIFIGDPAKSVIVAQVTLLNPRGRPMSPGNTEPMIQVNAQSTRIINVSTARSTVNGTFGAYVQVDDDQAFLLDGLFFGGYGVRCDATFCGSFVTAPGPFNKWSAVGWLKNMNITAGCQGNGVDWKSGNTLRISDSVIQGARDFDVRTGYAGGGYGGTELDNVYTEAGHCANRRDGTAGVIAQGGRLTIRSDRQPAGFSPQFQNLGSTYYAYFVVISHATYGDSVPLAAGWAKTDEKTPVEVLWPIVAGAAHYKLLRMKWTGVGSDRPIPLGTGEWLVATVDPSACDASFCKFTDTHNSPASFTTVNTFGGGTYYFPKLDYWPGNIVLGVGSDTTITASLARLFTDNAPITGVVSVARVADGPVVYSEACQDGPSIGLGATTYPFMQCADPGPSATQKRGFILQSKSPFDGGGGTNLKGRLNFLTTGTGPSPLITWEDSDPNRTITNLTNRPTADVADSDSGIVSKGIQYTRANLEIRNYIGALPGAANWKEQLTAKQKLFAVPVAISDGNTLTLGAGSPLSQMKIFTATAARVAVPGGSCLDVPARVAGLIPADVITGITPPTPLGSLSVNAYAGGKDTLTLHFCNTGSAAANVPAGNYTFLAVH